MKKGREAKKEEKQIQGPEGNSLVLQVRRAVCSHQGPLFSCKLLPLTFKNNIHLGALKAGDG